MPEKTKRAPKKTIEEKDPLNEDTLKEERISEYLLGCLEERKWIHRVGKPPPLLHSMQSGIERFAHDASSFELPLSA